MYPSCGVHMHGRWNKRFNFELDSMYLAICYCSKYMRNIAANDTPPYATVHMVVARQQKIDFWLNIDNISCFCHSFWLDSIARFHRLVPHQMWTQSVTYKSAWCAFNLKTIWTISMAMIYVFPCAGDWVEADFRDISAAAWIEPMLIWQLIFGMEIH